MTCYLTDDADPAELERGKRGGRVGRGQALSRARHDQLRAWRDLDGGASPAALEAMEKAGMPLLVHGEVTDPEVDIFDREAVFLDKVLAPLLAPPSGAEGRARAHDDARRAWHSSRPSAGRLGGTITPHHLSFNRNAIFKGGIRPHFYCLPIAKREEHRLALRKRRDLGQPQFFLGTDTAPHTVDTKECACGCAGMFNAPVAMQVYAQVFAGGERARPAGSLRVAERPALLWPAAQRDSASPCSAEPMEAPEQRRRAGRRQEHRGVPTGHAVVGV